MGKKNTSKDNGKAKPRDPPPPKPKVLRSSGGSKPAVWLVAPAMIAILAAGVAYVGWPQGAPPHATLHQQNVTSAVESAASAAASASSAELPRGWGSAMDPSSGKPYYYKLATRESTWERPTEPCDDESVVASAEQQQQQLGKEGEDVHEHCGYWAAAGECASNPSFMEQQCKTSCAHTAAALKSGKAARGLASGKARGHPTTHTTHTTHTTPHTPPTGRSSLPRTAPWTAWSRVEPAAPGGRTFREASRSLPAGGHLEDAFRLPRVGNLGRVREQQAVHARD